MKRKGIPFHIPKLTVLPQGRRHFISLNPFPSIYLQPEKRHPFWVGSMTIHCLENQAAPSLWSLPVKSIIGSNPTPSLRSRCNRGGRGVRKVKKEWEIGKRKGSPHFSHFFSLSLPFPLPDYVCFVGYSSIRVKWLAVCIQRVGNSRLGGSFDCRVVLGPVYMESG